MRKLILTLPLAILFAASAPAGEKGMMHCFAFTVIKEATPADWAAWEQATDKLPKTMKGIVKKVWHGDLNRPLALFAPDAATRKKFTTGVTSADGKINRIERQHGACMLLANQAALPAYEKHPAHADWVKLYEKVRVAGTTTFDIIGK